MPDLPGLIAPDGTVWLPGHVSDVGAGPILRKNTQSAENAATTSLACNKPSDLADGDVIWAAVSAGDAQTITKPSGSWVEVAQVQAGGATVTVGLFYLPVSNAAGEPASYTWTISTSTRLSISQTGYSGIDPATIQDATATTALNGGAVTSLAIGSLTTVTSGAKLISCCGNNSAGTALILPVTMSQVFQSIGTGKRLAVADEMVAVPNVATGTRTWTQGTALAIAGILAVMRPVSPAGGGDANAPAENAAGTGAAHDAQVTIAPAAENAAGIGAALDSGSSIGASTENAAGTGAALDPAASIAVNAENASGTGVALDPTVLTGTLAPAENAAGTGAALDAAASVQANAEAASGTGTAQDAAASIGVPAGATSGTGAAQDAQAAITPNAENASGTGTANDATVLTGTLAQAENAAGVGAALDPAVKISTSAENAAGTGAANNATVATSKDAPAENASGTGQALDPTIQVAPAAENAAGTGVALDATVIFQLVVIYATGTVTLTSANTGDAAATATSGTGTLGSATTGTATINAASGTTTLELADTAEVNVK